MKKYILLILNSILSNFVFQVFLYSQVSINSLDSPYTQNFDALSNTGTANPWTDNSTIAGWYANLTTYRADDGNSNVGAMYSYGTTASSERAFGGLTSNTIPTVRLGVRIVNNTGSTIGVLQISYIGEQWRRQIFTQSLVFDYQVDAGSLTSGSWTSVPALDFTAPKTGTAGALDGNAVGNKTTISESLFVAIPTGHEIWLRWTKTFTNSPGLAIDDFSVTGYAPLAFTQYYSKSSGDLDNLSNWGTNTDGSGTSPSDFTSDNKLFHIQNNATPTIGANWIVSGVNSQIILGDNSTPINFTIPSSYTLTGVINLTDSSTITLQNTTLPTFNSIAANSDVVFNQSGTYIIPSTPNTFGSLTLVSGTKTFPSGFFTVNGHLVIDGVTNASGNSSSPYSWINIAKDFILQNSTFFDAGITQRISINCNGVAQQTLRGNGSDFIISRFLVDNASGVVLSTTGGSSNLNLSLGYALVGGNLSVNGNTLTVEGGTSSYLTYLSGTLTVSSSSNLVFNRVGTSGTLGTLKLTPSYQSFNNLTLNLTGVGDSLTMGSNITIGGTLAVTNGVFAVAGRLTNNGTVNINDRFRMSDTTVVSGNAFVYGVNGSLIFNNSSSRYNVNNDPYWPSSNGPPKVIQQNGGGIQMNIARTVSKLYSGFGGVTNGNNLTITDTLQINPGGYIDGSPIYTGTATLTYSTNGSYSVWNEWSGTGSIGVGVPHNILVQNNTQLNMPLTDRGVTGNITISSGSLTLNNTSGNLYVGGNWTNNGTFTANSRIVIFNSTSAGKTITGSMTGSNKFYNLTFDGVGGEWSLNNGIEIGNNLTIASGTLDANSKNITLGGNWSNSGTFTRTGSTVTFNGTGSQLITNSSGESFNNLIINNTAGVFLNNNITIDGNLSISSGNLNTGTKTITLSAAGNMVEQAGATVLGNITTTRNVISTSGTETFGNIGSDITLHGTALGNTTVLRKTGTASSGSGVNSILRYFDVTPTTNTGLNADLVFHYDVNELNSQDPSTLRLYKSTNNGLNWIRKGGIVNTDIRTVTVTGLNDFSFWTVGGTPSPTITWINPTVKVIGDTGFTLTINGGVFIQDSSIVRFNGNNRTTTYINESKLTASIPASDLTTVGTYNITVFTSGGGGESNAQQFNVIAPSNGSISGSVFNDINGNGEREPGDTSLSGWTINLEGPQNGKALSFDGVDDYVSVGPKFGAVTDNFTMELWVNPTATRISTSETNSGDGVGIGGQRYAIFPAHGLTQYGSGHAGAGISIGTNGISVFEHSDAYLPSLLVLNTALTGWNHVTVVYINKQPSLYLNGNMARVGLTSTMIVHPSADFGESGVGYGYYNGIIDEVRIWNRALSETEIKNNMYRRLTGSESGLIVYYNMDNISSNTITDISGQGNTGTLVNGTGSVSSSAPQVGSQVTDALGNYIFSNLPAANYTLSESLKTNWIQTYPQGFGTHNISLGMNEVVSGKDFGNVYGYSYVGPSSGNWSDTANWSGGHTPDSTNSAVIPPSVTVTVDTLVTKNIKALKIERGGYLNFLPGVGRLKVNGKIEIDNGGNLVFSSSGSCLRDNNVTQRGFNATGQFILDTDTTGIICYSDFVNRGTFDPGHSIITFTGNQPKVIASEGVTNTFYKLEVAGDSTCTIGNVTVKNQLILPKAITPREQDSIIVENNDTSAISDTGIVIQGTIKRNIKPGETGAYRFESPGSYIKFSGEGTNPCAVSMTILSNPMAGNFYWDSLGGRIDTLKNTIVVDTARKFSRWPFGFPRPRIVNSRADSLYCKIEPLKRMYVINPECGDNYRAQVSLRYDPSELSGIMHAARGLSSVSTSESDLKLFRGPYFADSVRGQWNMISLPLIPDSTQKDTLFPTSTSSAFSYDGTYIEEPNLSFSKGYWLKFPSAQQVIIMGEDRDNVALPVKEGWNMIGSISYPIAATSVTSNPAGIITSDFFGYTTSYQTTDTLYPLQSYWVKTSSAGKLVLIISEGGSFAKKYSSIFDQLNMLTISDARVGKQQLYFGQDSRIDVNRYEFPPIPPVGVFDTRYSTGRMVALAERETKEYPILISSTEYPVTIRWEMKDAVQGASLIVDGHAINLSQTGSTEISNPTRLPDGQESEIKLRLGSASLMGIPKEFALHQNYPNPFNPTTTIKYELPITSNVTLRIYNILGQEVITLVDEVQVAGFKSVEWNASDYSSGVYFYRLTINAGEKSFIAVKKLLLMK